MKLTVVYAAPRRVRTYDAQRLGRHQVVAMQYVPVAGIGFSVASCGGQVDVNPHSADSRVQSNRSDYFPDLVSLVAPRAGDP